MHSPKDFNVETIKEIIQSCREPEEIYDAIFRAIQSQEGKKITVRLVRQVTQVPGVRSAYIEKSDYSDTRTLDVWLESGERIWITLNDPHFEATKDGRVHADIIRKSNPIFDAVKDRNRKRQTWLQDEARLQQVAKLVRQYHEAVQGLQEVLEDCPDKYPILDEAQVKLH